MIELHLNPDSDLPVYRQIIEQIKRAVVEEKILPHHRIPSVRTAAKMLKINPNTVQKAYMQLEKEGIVYSVSGKGDYIADSAEQIKRTQKSEIREMFIQATKLAKKAGYWPEEIFMIIDEAYSAR